MEAFNKSRPLIGARGVGLAQGAIDLAIGFLPSLDKRVGDDVPHALQVCEMLFALEALDFFHTST